MLLGMLDLGSNSVKLQMVDGRPGAPPLPAYAFKSRVHLAEATDHDGSITEHGARKVIEVVCEAVEVARAHHLAELIVFATAWMRDAENGDEIRTLIESAADVTVQQLSGEDEARLAFLAAHRWYGWSAGRLLLVDIGGGSIENAYGHDEEPEVAISLPLGAGRVTRDFLHDDPPTRQQRRDARREARSAVAQVAERLRWEGIPSLVVGSSKTIKQLARITGAPPAKKGPFVQRTLALSDLRSCVRQLSHLDADQRGAVRGVARSRRRQIIGGAIVAEAAMRTLDIETIEVCPWAVREGVLLRRLDRLDDPAERHDTSMIQAATLVART